MNPGYRIETRTMRYQIDAWLDQGDPHLKITDADSGAIRLQWIYHREPNSHPECADGASCAGCSALHGLINHLFLLACADGLAVRHDHPALEPQEHLQANIHAIRPVHKR